MAEGSGWCTIESDPGVFTALLSEIGVKDVEVAELYALEPAALSALGRVHGLVFLFKYGGERSDTSAGGDLRVPSPDGVFFAQQVITNACATQAILSIVLNAPGVDAGPELGQFREFASGMDAAMTGLVISNSEAIRDAHNSFAPPTHFALDAEPDAEKEDAFHFVSFVPVGGRLYELDGLQKGPRDHGPVVGDGWFGRVVEVLQARIASFAGDEIRFNLMAVTGDARKRLRAEKDALREAGDAAGVRETEAAIAREEQKRSRWERENARRRWNFLPFIVQLLKVFAQEEGCIDEAVKSVREKKTKALEEANKEAAAKAASKN